MRKYLLLGLLLGLLLVVVSPSMEFLEVSAGGPVFWRINSRSEVEKGDSQGISIDDNGRMALAPALVEIFDTKQAYVWSTAADGAGNLYLGTGHEGRIFKVDSSGKGTLLYKAPELDVMALAVDAQGNVYAGTAPDGKVYKITPGGVARLFFDPKTKYIWSLAFDSIGRLYVGTGDKGVIFRVTPDGKGAPFVNTSQTNITAMAFDLSGNLIAGTDPGGLILKFSSDGKAFTLFDTPQREIRELGIGKNGEILALALADAAGVSGGVGSSPPAAAPTMMGGDEGGVTITISDVQPVDAGSASSAAPVITLSGGQSKAALYRLDQNGGTDLVWDSKDAAAFAISLDEDANRIIIGSGSKGRIYSTFLGQKSMLLAQTPQAQTSRFIRSGNQIYIATSNLGKLYKLSPESAVTGTYTSSIRDAQGTANWGRISWTGEGSVELQTRSGNTSSPDSTWSDWSAPITSSEGDAIKSPPARFIQWKATLKKSAAASPKLREVALSYLPRNIAPQITSLSVLPSGVSLQALPQPPVEGGGDPSALDASGASAPAPIIPPRRLFQKGALSLQWQAEDRNGDLIEYAVYFRDANKNDYFPLKTGLRDTYFTVDPNSLPDGRYVFKIVASDSLSNPGNLSLRDEYETEPVEIDNTAPIITIDPPRINGNTAEVVFRVVDATSIIRRGEYQIDGGAWKTVFPIDGIADSKREEFRVTVPLTDNGSHIIAVRGFDATANVSSAQATLRKR
jgi:hypothetical protein